jgi:predicted DNA binding CopG/RHH family protein
MYYINNKEEILMNKEYEKEYVLDEYEQDIEDNLELCKDVEDQSMAIAMLKESAKNHTKRKKAITIRISEMDLEIMQLKASKLGIPYQTYINMVVHKDASTGF